MRLVISAALAAAVAFSTAATGYAVAERGQPPPQEPLGPEPVTVLIDIEHSSFEPSYLRVEAGTQVRFVVRNRDPINHELIVGPGEVHDRHRDGTEEEHPPAPGEVSVAALERGATVYRFDQPGIVEMACHLPRHYDFGMRGEIEVIPAAPRDGAQASMRSGRPTVAARTSS